MIKIEQLEKHRRMILRGFTVEQLDNPLVLESLKTILTNIDKEMCNEKSN